MWRSWDLEVWTDTVSVELEDFDFGLESAGDQGDDSFGELQRIWWFSDHCVLAIDMEFREEFILGSPLINRSVLGLNFFDIHTVNLSQKCYVRRLMNVQFENCKYCIKFHRVGSAVQNILSAVQNHSKPLFCQVSGFQLP